jgi:hypothetical protein
MKQVKLEYLHHPDPTGAKNLNNARCQTGKYVRKKVGISERYLN